MEWPGNLNEYDKLVIRMNTPRLVFYNPLLSFFEMKRRKLCLFSEEEFAGFVCFCFTASMDFLSCS